MESSGTGSLRGPKIFYTFLKRFQAGIGYNKREGKENTAQIKEAA